MYTPQSYFTDYVFT